MPSDGQFLAWDCVANIFRFSLYSRVGVLAFHIAGARWVVYQHGTAKETVSGWFKSLLERASSSQTLLEWH